MDVPRSATQSQDHRPGTKSLLKACGDRSRPATVDVPEGAAILGLSPWSLYRLIRQGQFPVPTLRVGGRVLILRRPFERMLNGESVDDGIA